MTDNGLRALVGTAPAKIGTFLFEFATPGIGQILKAAGADFAVLDMEHTGFGFDTVRQVVRYMQAMWCNHQIELGISLCGWQVCERGEFVITHPIFCESLTTSRL